MKKATERQFTFPKNEIDKGTRVKTQSVLTQEVSSSWQSVKLLHSAWLSSHFAVFTMSTGNDYHLCHIATVAGVLTSPQPQLKLYDNGKAYL